MDYRIVEETLIKADAEYDAAECHGVMCGLICAAGSDALEMCVGVMFPEADRANLLVQESVALVTEMFAETMKSLEDPTGEFMPLLPDDEAEMEYRIQMLGQWCQGLLVGLHAAGIKDFNKLDGDVPEILHDVGELARADMYAVEGSEQDENAYMELVEFLRTAVLLMYEEMQPLPHSGSDDQNQRLH